MSYLSRLDNEKMYVVLDDNGLHDIDEYELHIDDHILFGPTRDYEWAFEVCQAWRYVVANLPIPGHNQVPCGQKINNTEEIHRQKRFGNMSRSKIGETRDNRNK